MKIVLQRTIAVGEIVAACLVTEKDVVDKESDYHQK